MAFRDLGRSWCAAVASLVLAAACGGGKGAGSGGATGAGGAGMPGPGTGGSRGQAEDAGAPDAGGAATQPTPDAADGAPGVTGPLADTLARTWISASSMAGNCTDLHTWYTFGADGSVVERDIDQNACYGVRLVEKITGAYTLHDRVVEMTMNGLGAGKPYLTMSQPLEPVAKLVDRFSIVSGKITPPWIGAGYLAVDDTAHTSTDGAHFESRRYVSMESSAGARLFEQDLSFAVTVDPPLPLTAGQACHVQVDFTLALFDAAAPVTNDGGMFRIAYDAVARVTEEGWMRLMPQPLDGLSNEDQYTVWHQMLDNAGLSANHSLTFARTFDLHFNYYLGYPDEDPHVLTQNLPQTGRWLEATTPPPIQ